MAPLFLSLPSSFLWWQAGRVFMTPLCGMLPGKTVGKKASYCYGIDNKIL